MNICMAWNVYVYTALYVCMCFVLAMRICSWWILSASKKPFSSPLLPINYHFTSAQLFSCEYSHWSNIYLTFTCVYFSSSLLHRCLNVCQNVCHFFYCLALSLSFSLSLSVSLCLAAFVSSMRFKVYLNKVLISSLYFIVFPFFSFLFPKYSVFIVEGNQFIFLWQAFQ